MKEKTNLSVSDDKLVNQENFTLLHHKTSKNTHSKVHSHSFYEIMLVLNGDVSFQVEDNTYKMPKNAVFIAPPKRDHRTIINSTKERYDRYVLWLSSQFINDILERKPSFHLDNLIGSGISELDKKEVKHLTHLFDTLISLSKTDPDYAVVTKSILSLIIVNLNKLHHLSTDIASAGDKQMQEVISYINSNLTESLSLDSIAQSFFVSKFHLMRRFKDYTGTTIYAYIQSKRIALAKSLLLDDVNATDVAAMCGFANYVTFYKSFMNETNISPSAYKEETLKNNSPQ